MYKQKQGLALNNQQWLICDKIKRNKINIYANHLTYYTVNFGLPIILWFSSVAICPAYIYRLP